MQPLKPLLIPLAGKNLIQASAGTGKTWTISLLYVRLVVEQLLTVEQILVVTYTRAATEELRSRIRARLKETLAVYEQPEIARHEYAELLAAYPPTPERSWYLKRALLSFDEAAVFTIHSFCQRVLQQHAFEVGLPFDSELVDSEATLQLALADQFWQQRLVNPNSLEAAVLKQHTLTPDSLLLDVTEFVGKPYLLPIRAETVSDAAYQQAEQSYQNALAPLEALWRQTKEEVLELLTTAGALNQSSYKPKQCKDYCQALTDFLAGKPVKELEKSLDKLTPNSLTAKTNKNKTTPQHAVFRLIETFLPHYQALRDMQTVGLDQLRYDLLLWLREQLPERKRQAGILAFDDLLLKVQDALEVRPKLAEQLAEKYRVALVDEFQDTDPVQYQVFEKIYQTVTQPDTPTERAGQVYYVGDPKQAIYSFRGADIYTYLQAANSVPLHQQYTLDRNFRSESRLIEAFNCLYAPALDPFRNQQRIGYERVQAGGTVIDTLQCEPTLAPLRLWNWAGGTSGVGGVGNNSEKAPNSTSIMQQVALAVANDIARLLQEAQAGRACIGNRALNTGDFAVLVRSHRQGRMIREALQTCGITSVQKSPLSIFQTLEAQELRWVLAAITEPHQIAKIRRALVTELMGGDVNTLLALDNEPHRFDLELEDFYRWHQLWQNHGFMPMFRDWLERRAVRKRLLAYVDGERRLTNVLHLGELIHTETRRDWRGMQATIRWLQRNSRVNSSEEHQLRLESDENLVQIVTIHKSKGLQYPIVYCPFLWRDSKKVQNRAWFTWHDAMQGSSCLQAGQLMLDQARSSQQAELYSENLRLLYVALTRAQYHCTVVLATGEMTPAVNDSALNWLLFGHLKNADTLMATKSAMPQEKREHAMQQALQALVDSSQGSIACEALPSLTNPLRYQASRAERTYQCRNFRHTIPQPERIGSFTGLTAGSHDERPDYDQAPIELEPIAQESMDHSHFPRGRRAGVCLHKIFERLDFTQPLTRQRTEIIEHSLLEAGFAKAWRPAAEQLLKQTLHTPLLPNRPLSLNHIARSDRLDEMEFYFPVEQLKVSQLKKLLLQHLPKEWKAIRQAVRKLSFGELKGFMKGYIDLVFRFEGKYYLADYKSNWLGQQPSDYTPAALIAMMADAHYYLQYLIYCVALHRYLQQRIPDYAWEQQVGGVFYLFLRGMGQDPLEPQNGVFYHCPSAELIHALDGLMEGGR